MTEYQKEVIIDVHFLSKAIAQIIWLLKIIISLSMLSLSILDYERCVLCKVHKSFHLWIVSSDFTR